LKLPDPNNLGGKGPDHGEESMLFFAATTIKGVSVDLKVTSDAVYFPANSEANGVQGSLGAINLKVCTTSNVTFSLVESGTNTPVNVDGMSITFLDLDEGKRGKQRSTVTVCEAELTLDPETELTTSNGSCTSVSSSKKGSGDDNPTSIEDLTDVQKRKVATFKYGAGNSFSASLGIGPKGKHGRNFNFYLNPIVIC